MDTIEALNVISEDKNTIVYLAGGINKLSDSDAMDWREEFKERAAGLPLTILDPMRRDYRGREHNYGVAEEITRNDQIDVVVADVLVVNGNNMNRPTWGTAMEVQMAFSFHKFIITICDEELPSPWLPERSSVMVKSVEEAVRVLEENIGVGL